LWFDYAQDKKRWRDGLLEADRLDRQVCLALSHSAATSQSKRTATQTSETKASDSSLIRTHKSSATFMSSSADQGSKLQLPPRQHLPTSSVKGRENPPIKPPNSSSDFSAVLARASSPPTSRRSSLRMLLYAASANGHACGSDTTLTAANTTHSFPRIKTPPRYASRAVINDTYMRRICRDSVEKYKRTASEIYRANVERMAAKHASSRSPTADQSESENSLLLAADDSQSQLTRGPNTLRSDLDHLSPEESFKRVQPASPIDSISSSSSSSLELVGIEQATTVTTTTTTTMTSLRQNVDSTQSPLDEEAKQSGGGDVDSGLGGSDDTGHSEQHAHLVPEVGTIISSIRAPADAICVIDEGHGTDASLSNTSVDGPARYLKSILRKSLKTTDPDTRGIGCVTDSVATAQSPSSSAVHCRSYSVRFHPLALLLDAALEGDLELVKKAASQVSDVSEPNDEGITALHNAVCAGRTEIAEFLVRTAGADVNAGDTDGWTPLHCAASCANLPLARLLVEHGASLHARTLSDQETPLEKCDQGDEEAECEEYLFFQQERIGSAASGRVYALFPRGLEAAGPGSADAHIQSDELAVYPNEPLTIIDREPVGETEWMLAEKADGTRGLIPRSHVSCYPLVRIPPASHPVPIIPARPRQFDFWVDDEDEEKDVADSDEDLDETIDRNNDGSSHTVVEFDRSHAESPILLMDSESALGEATFNKSLVSVQVSSSSDELPQSDNGNRDLKTAL
ncbi:hypothetical protein EG68_04386, partial [Paragonimus skrjabini miyazakii]